MKYLYCILRLFFCPHKYKIELTQGNTFSHFFDEFEMEKVMTGHYYDRECNYCGKIKRFKSCT